MKRTLNEILDRIHDLKEEEYLTAHQAILRVLREDEWDSLLRMLVYLAKNSGGCVL